jgi:8-amino-7-oxononanoate synthase
MFGKEIRNLKEKNLFRELRDRGSSQGARIEFSGKEYINFSSNDYLGLANHNYVIDKVRKALDEYGFGSGASRLMGGGSELHKEIEDRIARFKTTEAALVFNSGYAANTGVIPCIAGKDTTIFSDEFNHASIIDGCRLSGSKTLVYRHRDMTHLEELLKRENSRKKLVVTDTVFSMDGDIAPLPAISGICRNYGTILYLDEAHATGVIGNGSGALAHFGMKPEEWIIQMGTFSKAFGSVGAFLAGNADVVQWTLNTARSFIYSTALPACVIAGSMAALELIENDPALIKKLWENRSRAVDAIRDTGFDIRGSETPIIPIMTVTVEETLQISRHLLEKGIFAPGIRPPTVKEPRIRITVTAAHTDEDIGRLIEALKEAKSKVHGA